MNLIGWLVESRHIDILNKAEWNKLSLHDLQACQGNPETDVKHFPIYQINREL